MATISFRATKESTVIRGKIPNHTQVKLLVKYQMIDADNQMCYRLPEQFSITLSAKEASQGHYRLELPLKSFNEDCEYSYHSAQYHISGPSIEEYILLESPESLQEQVKLLSANLTIPEIHTIKKIICEFESEELGLCEVGGALPDSYLVSPQIEDIEIHVLNSSEETGA